MIDRLPRPLAWLAAARSPTPRTRGALLLAAAVVFVGGGAWSLASIDVTFAEVRWAPLALVAVVLTPATILVNAAELEVMARAVRPTANGDEDASDGLGWTEAVRVVVVATAANLLPVPGAALVRIQALRSVGASGAAATGINLAGAGMWVGVGLTVAGLAAGRLTSPVGGAAGRLPLGAGALLVVVGIVGMAVSTWLVRRSAPWRLVVALLGVEVAVIVLHGVRLLVVLAALDVALGLRQALVIAVSAPLAAAAGVFPSGLGLAEAISAGLAPLVALPAAAGFAATAVNRVVGVAVTAPIALALGARDLR